MLVAGYPEVLQIAEIDPELEGVVDVNVRPVVHELELLHSFDQRAVAVVVKRVSKVETTLCKSPADAEMRHAQSRGIVSEIQAGGAGVLGEGAGCQRIYVDWLAIPANAKVSQQIVLDRVVESGSKTLGPGFAFTDVSDGTELGTADNGPEWTRR